MRYAISNDWITWLIFIFSKVYKIFLHGSHGKKKFNLFLEHLNCSYFNITFKMLYHFVYYHC